MMLQDEIEIMKDDAIEWLASNRSKLIGELTEELGLGA